MKPSSRAMIWYFSHQWRWVLPILALLSVSSAFLLRWMQGSEWGFDTLAFMLGMSATPDSVMKLRDTVIPVLNCVQFCLLAMFLGCMFLVNGQNNHVPHNYLLTLPLSTRRFLTVSFCVPLSVVALMSGAAMALHFRLFGNTIGHQGTAAALRFWDLPLLCLAAAALLQGLFHLSLLKSEFRAIPMFLALGGMACLWEGCLIQLTGFMGHCSVVLAPAALFLSAAFSHHALAAYRNGRLRGGIPALLEWFRMGRGRTRAFSSAGAALYWLGWRRHGRGFSLLTALFCPAGALVALVGAILVMYYNPSHPSLDLMAVTREAFGGEPASGAVGGNDNPAALVLFWTLLVFGGAAFISHIWMVTPGNEELLGSGSAYYLTLPVRGADLARGRILAMATSTVVVAAAGAGFLLLFVSIFPGTVLGSQQVLMLLPFVLAFGLWLILWFGFPISVVSLAFILGSGLVQLLLDLQINLASCLLAAGVFSAVVTAFFLALGILRRAMAWKDLLLFGVACLPCLGIAAFIAAQNPLPNFPPLPYAFTVAMLALPVALPFAAMPVAVNWIRHR